MVKPGVIGTEGAYIRCNDQVSQDRCYNNGAFSEGVSIGEASASNKVAIKNGTPIMQNGSVCYCPLMRCDVRTEELKYIPLTTNKEYKTLQVGDNLCLMLKISAGYVHIGCKQYANIDTTKDPVLDKTCFSKTACTNSGQHSSKTFWSVTSRHC